MMGRAGRSRLALGLIGGVIGAGPVQAAPRILWERIVAGETDKADSLVARAQSELAETSAGQRLPDGLLRAETLLLEALRVAPSHFLASALLGETRALQGDSAGAVAAFARACPLALGTTEASACWLRLGLERSRLRHYAAALADYEWHLGLGGARPEAFANAAELLMALGRLDESERRFVQAVDMALRLPKGRVREETAALALFGLAVVQDRAGKEQAAAESLARALELDPRADLLERSRDPKASVFFVPPEDGDYYRALVSMFQHRTDDAGDALRAFLRHSPDSRYAARAQAHLARLFPPAPVPVAYRAVAGATVRSQGPISALALDATWKTKLSVFDGCLSRLPSSLPERLRFRLDLILDGQGKLQTVLPVAPAGWPVGQKDAWAALGVCLEQTVRDTVTGPAARENRETLVSLEIVIARKEGPK